MNEQQRGQEAFKLHEKISGNETRRRELMIENILLLEKMREDELYKDFLGDENAPWTGYLAELEVFYTRARVQKWIYIMKKLVKPFDIALIELITIPESRLEEVARYSNAENYKELLEQAKVLTPHDWHIVLSKIKGIDLENCRHESMQKLEVCNTCGEKHKIN